MRLKSIPDRASPWLRMLAELHCWQRKIVHLRDVSRFAYELRNRIVLLLDPMVPNTFSYPNRRSVLLVPFQRSPVMKNECVSIKWKSKTKHDFFFIIPKYKHSTIKYDTFDRKINGGRLAEREIILLFMTADKRTWQHDTKTSRVCVCECVDLSIFNRVMLYRCEHCQVN